MTNFHVVSLFPEMFDAISQYGITSRALAKNLIGLDVTNPRKFTEDRHRTVDDRPYGGGPGMLMLVEPLERSLLSIQQKSDAASQAKVVYLSPQGAVFNQAKAQSLSELDNIVLIAGRYEGLDQRFIDTYVDEEISMGDFVVSGGELPAMMLIDAVSRLKPGVLGHNASAEEDSFFQGLLDHPQYTRPEKYTINQQEHAVPDVLLSGNHKAIKRWRLMQSLGQTWLKRPDLLEQRELDKEERSLLDAFKQAFHTSGEA